MKKFILFILLILPLPIMAQHMSFMGISFGKDMNVFFRELKDKGFSESSTESDYTVKIYQGTFYGQNSKVIVKYDPRIRRVYYTSVNMRVLDLEAAESLMLEIVPQLTEKYNCEPVEKLDKNGNSEFTFYVDLPETDSTTWGMKSEGIIVVAIDEEDGISTTRIMYIDTMNSKRVQKQYYDDL